MPTLHVVIPVYNEPGTLGEIVDRVLATRLPAGWHTAIILVDDFSAPVGRSAVESVATRLAHDGRGATLLMHEENRGKGAALQTGFDFILEGAGLSDAVIIQDADLEYDPSDFPSLLEPLLEGWADAVFGSRWGEHRDLPTLAAKIHAAGNAALTTFSNLLTGLSVLDMECCYKLLSLPTLQRIRPMLTETRFGIEPQIAAALARTGSRMGQRPVRYNPRGFSDGKKIGIRDAIRAIYVILRERGRGGSNADSSAAVTGSGL